MTHNTMNNLWIKIFHNMLEILPLNLILNDNNNNNNNNNHTNITIEKEEICLKNCNIIFELIIKYYQILRINNNELFHKLWIDFIQILANNLNQSIRLNNNNNINNNNNNNNKNIIFQNEMIEIIVSLLRVLQPRERHQVPMPTAALINHNTHNYSNNNTHNNNNNNNEIKSNNNTNKTIKTQLKEQTIHKTNNLQNKTPQKLTGMFGFISGFFNFEETIIESKHSNSKPLAPAESTASHELQAEEELTEEENPEVIIPIPIISATYTQDKTETGDLLFISSEIIVKNNEETKENLNLMILSWNVINIACVSFPTHLRAYNPQLLNDFIKFMENSQRIHSNILIDNNTIMKSNNSNNHNLTPIKVKENEKISLKTQDLKGCVDIPVLTQTKSSIKKVMVV